MADGRFRVPEDIAVRVPAEAMRGTVEDLFIANGMPEDHARQATDVLIWADLRGIDSHGVSNMMAFYLQGLKEGTIKPKPEWKATLDSPERVARFRSFVNSDRPDPTIVHITERGQIRPAVRETMPA